MTKQSIQKVKNHLPRMENKWLTTSVTRICAPRAVAAAHPRNVSHNSKNAVTSRDQARSNPAAPRRTALVKIKSNTEMPPRTRKLSMAELRYCK